MNIVVLITGGLNMHNLPIEGDRSGNHKVRLRMRSQRLHQGVDYIWDK
jgi:hypothetical protein